MLEQVGASIQDITAFVAVAQTGSFTRAAEDLGSNKSNVGKAVQRLEKHLGARLFQRTTRAVRLTEDGETYLKAALQALDSLRDAELSLAARRAEPIGRVKVDVPAGLGRLLLPTLSEFRVRYPKVMLELALTDRMSDPVAEGWDIVVRIGELAADSDMSVRKLCDLKLALYASPSYLSHSKIISSVADLGTQDAVVFRGPSGRLRAWTVAEHGETREYVPTPVLVLSDGQALVEAAVLGLGVAQILDRVAQPHVASGRLVHVLPSAVVPGPPVHALLPLGTRMTAATRAVLDHFADVFRRAD